MRDDATMPMATHCRWCGNPILRNRKSWNRRYCSPQCGFDARRRSVSDRFWSKVDRSPEPDGCWVWTAAFFRDGYGRFTIDQIRRSVRAPRVAWELTNGPIPDGVFVCHRCDNPPCVRPDHLFLGTAADNNADRSAKGRNGTMPTIAPGNRPSYRTKLTAEQVVEIRQRAASTTATALAREFGVSIASICRILRGESWRHL